MRAALLTVALASCAQVFGLEEAVPLPPPPPDFDGDGIGNDDDNCPLASNPEQTDDDTDSFGDACDLCRALATPINHDEDGDRLGDDCDLCPTEPEFQADQDGDGVGDSCDLDNGNPMALVAFDPFVTLDDTWTIGDTPWQSTGDTAAPLAVLASSDFGLRASSLVLDGSRRFFVRIGLLSTRAWRDGDTFGIRFLDATGTERGRCMVTCQASACRLKLAITNGTTTEPNATPLPLLQLRIDYNPTASLCYLGISTSNSTMAHAAMPAVYPAIVGMPDVQLRYFAAWQ